MLMQIVKICMEHINAIASPVSSETGCLAQVLDNNCYVEVCTTNSIQLKLSFQSQNHGTLRAKSTVDLHTITVI
jgi:hypothetical protein